MAHVDFQPFRRSQMRTAFTLVELLVVIGIIALLIAILLPALNKARKASQALVCLSNLRTLGQGTQLYVNAYKGALPPNFFFASAALPALTPRMGAGETWDTKIVQQLGVKLVPDPNAPLDAGGPKNEVVPVGYRTPILTCPSDNRDQNLALRSYVGINAQDDKIGYTSGPLGTGQYVGTMSNGDTGNPATTRRRTAVKVTEVKKSQECVFLMEYWSDTPAPNNNIQFIPTNGTVDPPLGPTALPLGDALSGARYHNRRLHFLFVDGHAGPESPNDFHKYKWFWRKGW